MQFTEVEENKINTYFITHVDNANCEVFHDKYSSNI